MGPIDSIDSDNGLALSRRQAIISTNDGLGWWCIYASLGLNELRGCCLPLIVAYESPNHYLNWC